jgi:predicted SAM-dependent methyltransferase
MKNGALIRITVPDLEKYVNFYNGKFDEIEVNEFQRRYRSGCAAIRNMSQNYFHFSIWDFEELRHYLTEAGFVEIKRRAFSETADPQLNLDLKERAWETLYVEARKLTLPRNAAR